MSVKDDPIKRSSGSRIRTLCLAVAVALSAALAGAAPAAAQGPPTVSVGQPVVDGDYVSFAGTITSPDNCLTQGCPASYIISAFPLPPTAGFAVGSLFWGNQVQPQQLPLTVNMRQVTKQFTFPPNTTTYTVVLAAQYAGSSTAYSPPVTFTWPAGSLSLTNVKLVGARPRLAYRLRTGPTQFRSAAVTVTIRTPSGKRVGSFVDSSEPGQNLASVPKRLARRMTAGARYRIALRARDEFGRTARKSTVAPLL